MMDDADYQDKLCLNDIKYAVTALDEAAERSPIFRSGRSDERIFAEPSEGILEAAHIGLTDLLAENSNAIFVDFAQVGDSSIRKLDVNHASRAVWR